MATYLDEALRGGDALRADVCGVWLAHLAG